MNIKTYVTLKDSLLHNVQNGSVKIEKESDTIVFTEYVPRHGAPMGRRSFNGNSIIAVKKDKLATVRIPLELAEANNVTVDKYTDLGSIMLAVTGSV